MIVCHPYNYLVFSEQILTEIMRSTKRLSRLFNDEFQLENLFFGKKGNHYCEEASYYLKRQFLNSEVYLASKVSKFPDKYKNWSGDFIISYLTPFIIPEKLLRNTKIVP